MRLSLPNINFNNMLLGKKVLIAGAKNDITNAIIKLLENQGATSKYIDKPSSDNADILIFVPPVFEFKKYVEHTEDTLNKAVFNSIDFFTKELNTILPCMQKNIYGRIIPLIYDYVDVSVPYVSAFGLYSGAISALTKNIAMEYAKYNIRANCVMMGLSVGEQTDFWNQEISSNCDLVDCQPVKRCGTAEDVANAVLFLASEMSSFISAENIPLNGGANVIGHNQVWTDWLKKI